jgi:hypothetical protein
MLENGYDANGSMYNQKKLFNILDGLTEHRGERA